MKRLLSLLHCRYLHLGIAAIVCLSIFTACDTSNNSGGGTSSEPEEQPEEQYDKWDLKLAAFALNYDVNNFLRNYRLRYGGDPADWEEMISYHHIDRYTNTGVLFIQDILPASLYNGNPENRPKVSFSFHSEDLKTPVVKNYTQYDEKLCANYTVHDAPLFEEEYICDFHAQTLTTSTSCITIEWERSIPSYGKETLFINDGYGNNLNGKAVIVDPFLKSTTGDDEVAVRETTGGERVVVENTVPSNLRGETVSFRIVTTKPVVTDVLSQPVLKGGRVSTYKWKEPRLAKIQSK